MSIFFDASEILQFAVRIEENGEKFYRYATRVTNDDSAKRMFDYFANEETRHRKTFEDLLRQPGSNRSPHFLVPCERPRVGSLQLRAIP